MTDLPRSVSVEVARVRAGLPEWAADGAEVHCLRRIRRDLILNSRDHMTKKVWMEQIGKRLYELTGNYGYVV
jgi:hypothetical protein